jgi:serine/threonine protein kinase
MIMAVLPMKIADTKGLDQVKKIRVINGVNNDNHATLIKAATSTEGDPVLNRSDVEAMRNTLDLLNAQGIYHNDIHLRNIMKGDNGKVYIIDFGTADSQSISESESLDPEKESRSLRYFEQLTDNKASIERRKSSENNREFQHILAVAKKRYESDINRFLLQEINPALKDRAWATYISESKMTKNAAGMLAMFVESGILTCDEIASRIKMEKKFDGFRLSGCQMVLQYFRSRGM